jgi:hypothetical protein
MAVNKHAAVEEQSEAMFSVQSVQLYSDDHKEKLASRELETGFRAWSLYQAMSSDDRRPGVCSIDFWSVD